VTNHESAGTATTPRRLRPDKRRAILDAAAPIFGNEGYERASVDAIATAAGVSKPTIYSYFGGKDQLFRASVTDSAINQNADALQVILRLELSPEGWRASLYELGAKLVECQRSDCALFLQRMIAAESGRDPQIYRAIRTEATEPILETLAGRLAMLGNAGHLRIGDPALAARQFFALIDAEIPELTEQGTKAVPDEVIRRAVEAGVDTFLRAHQNPTSPTPTK
jgi:TetR/AcrR family transcriptional regulator, mexJK operon transcriptional repressor